MVAIVHPAPADPSIAADPDASASWLERIGAAYTPDERTAIARALDATRAIYGDLRTPDGEPQGTPPT